MTAPNWNVNPWLLLGFVLTFFLPPLRALGWFMWMTALIWGAWHCFLCLSHTLECSATPVPTAGKMTEYAAVCLA